MDGNYLGIGDGRGRVVLAMSGGVDSAVSAVELVEAGYDVVGLTMKNYCYGEVDAPERSCCSLEAIDDARAVCGRLGVRHLVVSTEEIFGREVYDDFLSEYRAGRTPNPCVRCNSIVRFDTLARYARRLGAERVATGHYARVFRAADGRLYLARSRARAKDQSYFLSGVHGEALERVIFPLGEREKPEVRAAARRAGLEVAEKPESQEVCFIPGGSLHDFLAGKVAMRPGAIETTGGEVVGCHEGLAAYTVGQRRGTGVAAGERVYVVALDLARNVLVVGDEEALRARELCCRLAWFDARYAGDGRSPRAQIRSRSAAADLEGVRIEGDTARVTFVEPQRALAPGQTVAFYDGDVVVGSGVIDGAA
ncbi:MAG: tRNA 2-thiouridine(34) synthase MnmA [Candidatus Krumholzibacteria bacterium]|nr:tRNA 2-thiouridine(34) synthase MnmA [Candidatus Krumholzibacteria bacterium]